MRPRRHRRVHRRGGLRSVVQARGGELHHGLQHRRRLPAARRGARALDVRRTVPPPRRRVRSAPGRRHTGAVRVQCVVAGRQRLQRRAAHELHELHHPRPALGELLGLPRPPTAPPATPASTRASTRADASAASRASGSARSAADASACACPRSAPAKSATRARPMGSACSATATATPASARATARRTACAPPAPAARQAAVRPSKACPSSAASSAPEESTLESGGRAQAGPFCEQKPLMQRFVLSQQSAEVVHFSCGFEQLLFGLSLVHISAPPSPPGSQ